MRLAKVTKMLERKIWAKEKGMKFYSEMMELSWTGSEGKQFFYQRWISEWISERQDRDSLKRILRVAER